MRREGSSRTTAGYLRYARIAMSSAQSSTGTLYGSCGDSRQEGKTNLSHDGLNPAHVPCWWVNNPTLPLGCGWEARKSRHRRIKKQRRCERLAATSQLSLW
jgi:hypothetical protein